MSRKRIFPKKKTLRINISYRYVQIKTVQYYVKSSVFNSNPQTFIICMAYAGTALGAGKTETNNLRSALKSPDGVGVEATCIYQRSSKILK